MPKGIIVFGLNGSGKSTLGKELACKLGYKYMDIEEYYFFESEVPYTKQRTREDCLELILNDIGRHENFVISAVKGDFNEEIASFFKMGVFMTAPYTIRIERVKQRAIDKFGDRIKLDGDMYQSEKNFLDIVKSRTQTNIDKWLESVSFPIVQVDGLKNIAENVDFIKEEYLNVLKNDE